MWLRGRPAEVFTPETLYNTYGAEMPVIHYQGMTLVAESPHFLEANGRYDVPEDAIHRHTAGHHTGHDVQHGERHEAEEERGVRMLEPFQYDFFVRGMIATGLVGGLCALIGVYIVLRGMAYIGHGLSHAIFGGGGGYLRDVLQLFHRGQPVGVLVGHSNHADNAEVADRGRTRQSAS